MRTEVERVRASLHVQSLSCPKVDRWQGCLGSPVGTGLTLSETVPCSFPGCYTSCHSRQLCPSIPAVRHPHHPVAGQVSLFMS